MGIGIARSLILLCSFGCSLGLTHELTELDDCNETSKFDSVVSLLDERVNTFVGWSHVNSENLARLGLKLTPEFYRVDESKYRLNEECGDSSTLNLNLLVKLSDWTQQHPNGLESLLATSDVKLESIGAVEVVFRLVSAETSVISEDHIVQRYGDIASAQTLSSLDDGLVTLGFTMFENGALDQATRSLNLDVKISIDQHARADRWLRLIIPITDFSAYFQKNYQDEAVNINDHLNSLISGLRITAETYQGKQLRNLLGDDWSESIPETVNEIGIEFRRIGLVK